MKKYIFFFLFLSLGGIIYLAFPIHSKVGFVSMRDNKFFLNGEEFYPVAVNYFVSAQGDENNYWASPCFDYNTDPKYQYTSKDSSLKQLRADMNLIKEMGFNSVRLVGMSEVQVDEQNGKLAITVKDRNHETSIALSSDASFKKYLSALAELVDIADKAGLKVILLTKVRPGFISSEDLLRRLAIQFRNDTTIMAFDLFNEPLYFDLTGRSKKEVYDAVRDWRKILRMYAPNQLTTIGLEGIREVFKWDPNILDVDFVSMHPYEYEPEQVRNEIYWYSRHIKKPWILGETAVPADGDSVDYNVQKKFAVKTLKQTYNCGGAGYSWWQYKDVNWLSFHANFMGVLNLKGETKAANDSFVIHGTRKAVSEAFKEFDSSAKKDSCICLSNYNDYSQLRDCRITGRLVDEKNNPVDGGVVLAWNQWWSHSYHAISKADGSFAVTGNFPFYHWMASATEYSMVRGDVLPDTSKVSNDKIPTLNLGDLKISKLSFIK